MTTTYVALLRGINVGGHKKVPMSQLRELLAGLGYGDVRTLLQSGNAVFTGPEQDPVQLARELETAIAEHFGFEVPCLVRTAANLRAVADRNPFPAGSFDPAQLVVVFLAEPSGLARLDTLDRQAFLPDEFRAGEREVYLHCPTGLGRSRLADTLGKSTFYGATATARNWNTITKLLSMTAG